MNGQIGKTLPGMTVEQAEVIYKSPYGDYPSHILNQAMKNLIGVGKLPLNIEQIVSKQTPDEKVLDYLERAREIVLTIARKYGDKDTNEHYDRAIIEIAKLLQREEKL